MTVKKPRSKKYNEPENYSYWCCVLSNEKQTKDFLANGDIRQKELIKFTLNYLKKFNKEMFEEIAGNKLLKKLKG